MEEIKMFLGTSKKILLYASYSKKADYKVMQDLTIAIRIK